MEFNKKEFDRTICFTFFKDYMETARAIAKDVGKDEAFDFIDGLTAYALEEVEPNFKGVAKYAWPTIRTGIDKSQSNRAKGFQGEDTEKTKKVIAYKLAHPNASQDKIKEETGVSKGKVNTALRDNFSVDGTYIGSYPLSDFDTFNNSFPTSGCDNNNCNNTINDNSPITNTSVTVTGHDRARPLDRLNFLSQDQSEDDTDSFEELPF